jgi:hypothetical protein
VQKSKCHLFCSNSIFRKCQFSPKTIRLARIPKWLLHSKIIKFLLFWSNCFGENFSFSSECLDWSELKNDFWVQKS